MDLTATRDGDGYVLDGEKTWISNGGIADLYTVFARTGEAPGARGLSAFLVPADTPGLTVAERLEVVAPHPLARLRFESCRVPASAHDRQARRRLPHRHVGARRLPLHRRRGGARLRPPRARREPGARHHARALRRADGRAADGAGPPRRHGARRRRRGAARLPRRLDQGLRRRPRHPRGGDGQALRHRPGAGGHRQGGADPRRRRRAPRPRRREPLPRNPGAAHLRGRLGRAEGGHRPPDARRRQHAGGERT